MRLLFRSTWSAAATGEKAEYEEQGTQTPEPFLALGQELGGSWGPPEAPMPQQERLAHLLDVHLDLSSAVFVKRFEGACRGGEERGEAASWIPIAPIRGKLVIAMAGMALSFYFVPRALHINLHGLAVCQCLSYKWGWQGVMASGVPRSQSEKGSRWD